MIVGIDAHKKGCVAKIFSDDYKLEGSFEFPTTREGLQTLYQKVPDGGVVVIESSTTGKLLSRVLQERYEVHMIAPPERKHPIKTDMRDAERIVKEDMLGYSRRCYIPIEYIEGMRILVSHIIQVGKKISRIKNQAHALLERNMLHILDGLSDPFGKEGLGRLSTLRECDLPDTDMDALKMYLQEMNMHLSNHADLEAKLAKYVEDDEDVKLLMTIPGMNMFTSSAVISRIGDIRRFPTKKHLCSFAGVVPRASNSGEYVSKHNSVKKGDVILKYALTCAVRGAVSARKNTTVKKHYRRMMSNTDSGQMAEVAAARKLTCIVWSILTYRKPFVEEDKYLTMKKMRRMANIKRREIRQKPDIHQLVSNIQMHQKALSMYPDDLEKVLGGNNEELGGL
jgi:transposase